MGFTMPGELHFQGTHWCLKQDAEQTPAAHSCLLHTRQGQVAAFVCCTVLGLLPLQLTAAGRHALYAKSPILIRRDTARRWPRAICGKKSTCKMSQYGLLWLHVPSFRY